MVYLGQAVKIPFSVLTTAGADYTTDATPPAVAIVQADLTHATSTNAAARVTGGLWAVALTAGEVSSGVITIAWSGSGIISGSKSLLVEADFGSTTIPGIKSKTDLITASNFEVTSPVTGGGQSLTLYRGADYKLDDGTALEFSNSDWPTLTSGTVTLKIGTTSFAGTITGAHACYFELSAADTAALSSLSQYKVEIHAVLADGHIPPPLLTLSTAYMKDQL